MYTASGKEYDFDSIVNQNIKQEFVRREVYACISDMSEFLFDYEGEKYATWDEWENLYESVCPECGCEEDAEEIDLDEIEILKAEDGEFICPICENEHGTEEDARDCCSSSSTFMQCNSCGHIYKKDEAKERPCEIFEYWLVSDRLGEKLRVQGQPVLQRREVWIWGRCCSGQAILLDYVISKICYEMGILEGQENEWSSKEVA